MACGLPVIVSAAAGVSEIVTNDVDGMVLDDPTDATKLATMVRRLYEDKEFRKRIGDKACETARRYTWECNGRDLATVFKELLRRKAQPAMQTLGQESQ
jgi:UDP-glucose:(heptosyl)LPS alpha-1,3-glucosyltransferase